MRIRLLLLLVVSVGCLVGSRSVAAQETERSTYTLVLRGVPMGQALEELVRLTEINLVYSSDLVADKHVYCARPNLEAEVLLQCILSGTGLDYVRSSAGTFVLMDAVEALPRFGHLAGSVVDGATSEPLPYANVLLADASTGTTSNASGLFSFASLLSGMHRVVVTYVGYETAVDSIWIEPGRQQRLEIALQPREVALTPVVINGLVQRLPSSTLGTGSVSGAPLTGFSASGAADVARGASRLLGVSSQQPLADLHIQGGSGGEHLTLLDGVPVRDPVSLGRHLSAFSPLAIERLTVHKAGFGAEHGSHLSGVINVEQDVMGTERRQVAFSADPVSLNGKVGGRFALPGTREGAVMVALRKSMWGVYQAPGVESLLRQWNHVDPVMASLWIQQDVTDTSLGVDQHNSDVAFSDLHAAARLQLSPFRSLHASAYRAGNQITSDHIALNTDHTTGQDVIVLTRDDYDWTNWVGQLRHSQLLGARSVGTIQVRGGWHASHYAYRGLREGIEDGTEGVDEAVARLLPGLDEAGGSEERNKIWEASLRAELSHSLSPRHHVEGGLVLSRVDSRFALRNQFLAPIEHATAAWDLAGYVRGKLSFGMQTTLEPSIRLTYIPLRQTLYAEPRLTVRYDRAGSRIGPYAVRLAGGLYRQFTNQFEITSSGSTSVVPYMLFWLPVDSTIAPPHVYHVAADVLLMPASDWTINLETYYKRQGRLLLVDYVALLSEHPSQRPAPDPASLSQSDFITPTRGMAYGGSVRVQRSGERVSAGASYSYSHARRRYPGRFDEQMQPVPWNEPHRLNLDASISLLRSFTVDVNWTGSWGRRWAVRHAYYDYLALRANPLSFESIDLSRPADHMVTPYYRLDAGLTYVRTWGRVGMQLRAFVVNVLDRENVYDWSLRQTAYDVTSVNRTLPGRHPAFSLRLSY